MTVGWGSSAMLAWLGSCAAVSGAYRWIARQKDWPKSRVVLFLSGVGIVAVSAWGLHDPLASMATYAASLMALNQLAPPLLLLGIPTSERRSCRLSGAWSRSPAAWLLDPWVAWTSFVALTIAVSLPGVFEPALSNALFSGPLGSLQLASGLAFWAQLLPGTQAITPDWKAGIYAWLGGTPMTVVGLIWMLSPAVLYAPYLNVICEWDVPPLLDQRWAGFIMVASGMPLQLRGFWLLLSAVS